MKIEQQLIDQEVQRLRIQMAEEREHENELRKKHQEMETIRLEKERQEMTNLKKKFDASNIENEIEAKRSLMAEKRAEDLVTTYLKAKNMRVTPMNKPFNEIIKINHFLLINRKLRGYFHLGMD